MLRILILFMCFTPFCVYAQEAESQYDFISQSKDLKHTFSGRIDKIIDGHTLLLQDGKIIRLTGLDTPSSANAADHDYALKAKTWLEEHLPAGREIMIYQTRKAEKGRKNRMGHELGHILTKNNKTEKQEIAPFWVQEKLLEQGFARVYTSPSNPQLYKELLQIEDRARQAQKGLWEPDSPFKLITNKQAPDFLGQFVVLQAPVTKTAAVNNTLYLNFGENWKTDFTIMVSTALRKKLSQKGINPTSIAGKSVRVRGWLREYNGPLIELETIEHLEILGSN